MPSIYAPTLPSEFTERMPAKMSELINQTVQAHQRRDRDLVNSYELLMRVAPPIRNAQRGFCQLIDPIVFENFLPMFASLRASRSNKLYWLFEALNQEDEESAVRAEKGLTHRAYRDGFDAALYDSDWVTLRDAAAPMYIGWTNKRRNIRELRYRVKGEKDAPIITDVEREPDVEYDEVPYMSPKVDRAGFDYHVPDRANFYMMTPDANSVDTAIGCGERMYYTANDLYDGIREYKFDEETVDYLLQQGPTGYDVQGEYRQAKREVSGTEEQPLQPSGIGYWEVFRWFGKMPIWTPGGGMEIPDYLRDDEFLWMICPRYDKILRFSYSPFQMRPYTMFRMMREPNGQGGESIPTIANQYQDEGTAFLRMGVDSTNFRTRPMMKRLVSNYERFGVQNITVGGNLMCERNLNEIEPVIWDHAQLGETMAWLQDNRVRAKSMISGAGYGDLPNKVRKEAEVEAAMAAVSAKIGLVVRNVQESGMERAALIHLSHLTQYGGSDPYTMYSRDGGQTEIPPEDWKKLYSIKAGGSSDDAEPAVVLAKKRQVMDIVRTSPMYAQAIQSGDMRPEFHLMRQVLAAFEEEIKPYFGEEPPPPDYMQLAAQVFAQIYQETTQMPIDPAVFMQSPQLRTVFQALIQAKQGPQGGQIGPMGGPQMPQQPQLMPQSTNGAVPVG